MSAKFPVFQDVVEASRRIAPRVRRTPVISSARFDALANARVFFKCENLQHTGAFKMRGALNAVWSLSDDQAGRGVATHSSGNHGAALAAAAAGRGIPAWIVVPANAVPAKLDNMRRYRPEIIVCEPGLANREHGLARILKKTRAIAVHPYDDAAVIAGQGTAVLELLDDEPELDTVLVPVGGGGLVSGTLLAVRALCPQTRVIGVEPEGADDAARAVASGQRVIMDNPSTIADGLRASLGVLNFEIIKRHIDAIVTVSDAEILSARKSLEQCLSTPVEPSSATVAAAILNKKVRCTGQRIGVIISGGNAALLPADAAIS